jgi:hypothetical protein
MADTSPAVIPTLSYEDGVKASAIEADENGTRYRAEDPEGRRWMFMQR